LGYYHVHGIEYHYLQDLSGATPRFENSESSANMNYQSIESTIAATIRIQIYLFINSVWSTSDFSFPDARPDSFGKAYSDGSQMGDTIAGVTARSLYEPINLGFWGFRASRTMISGLLLEDKGYFTPFLNANKATTAPAVQSLSPATRNFRSLARPQACCMACQLKQSIWRFDPETHENHSNRDTNALRRR
jgi:hypothetical protein